MKDIFNQTDFFDLVDNRSIPQQCAEISNNKLRKLIDDAPTVYGFTSDRYPSYVWDGYDSGNHSVKARVMFIEPIKKECAKHEPDNTLIIFYQGTVDTKNFSAKDLNDYLTKNKTCKHCGIELEPVWQEKK